MVHIWFFKQNSFFRLEWLQPVPRNTAFGYKERKINQNTHERKRTLKSNIYIDWETLSSFIASIFLTSHDSKDMGILTINCFLLYFLSKYLLSSKYVLMSPVDLEFERIWKFILKCVQFVLAYLVGSSPFSTERTPRPG